MSDTLKVQEAEGIAAAILWRQEHWEGESLRQSIMVVLFNYGDQYVEVECTQGEWSGVKGDLEGSGLPHCPNRHPLFEVSRGKCLALVERPDLILVAVGEDIDHD